MKSNGLDIPGIKFNAHLQLKIAAVRSPSGRFYLNLRIVDMFVKVLRVL